MCKLRFSPANNLRRSSGGANSSRLAHRSARCVASWRRAAGQLHRRRPASFLCARRASNGKRAAAAGASNKRASLPARARDRRTINAESAKGARARERETGRRINSRTGGRINRPTGRQTARHERPDGRLALLSFSRFSPASRFLARSIPPPPPSPASGSSFGLLLCLMRARARSRLGHPFQLLLLPLTFGRGV